ncbi:hypothetical protein R3P38DRAFT_2656084 [Favolaschia claudopus]|uniref:Uncharacterized protein n=1 Tax=Favolaschia claudopus TaxID=2862362 RepID=A0AAV9ZXY8_9AGAR
MPQSREVNIDGATIAAIAEFVLSIFVYCYHQCKFTSTDALRSPFPSHPDIRNPQRMNFLSFLQHQAQRSYRVGPPRGTAITGSSIGRGVERSVFRTILENVAADGHCWVPSFTEPGYVTFQISPLADNDRRAKLYAYGRVTALHLYYYGHGYQIGLWPVLAAVLGRKSMLLGEQFLRLVSPDVAAEFGPWFALHPGDPLPSSISHPVSSLFMSLLNVQPSTLPSTFTESQYEDFTVRLLAARIFGDPAPWISDDVREFQSGMRMPLRITAGRNFCDHFDDSPPLKTACLIAGMYCRQIQSADEVLSHLRFQCAAMAPPPQVEQMRQLFELRFKRYLTGVGHPPYFHDQGLVSTLEENSAAHTSPFFRLQLLLVAALESSSLPVNDNWSIRVPSHSYAELVLISQQAAENPEPLHFHTCTGGVDVRINAKFLDLLIKSPQGEAASEFDNWVHAQLYRADSTRLLAPPIMPPRKKKKPTLSQGIRRSARPTRRPRRADEDLSAASEAAPGGRNQSEHRLISVRRKGTHTITVAPSSALVLLDSREAYIAQIDSQDPAAELIRGLLSLLPASTYVAPVVPDQPAPPPGAEMTNGDEEAVVEVITVDDNSDVAPGNVHNIAQLKLHSPMHTEEHNTNRVFYFIGIITANGVRATFCVPGPNTETHRLGGAIDWLIFQNRPAGRMLQSLSPASDFSVGVSREPEDVDKEFMNYRRAFTEIGSLEGVLAAPADSPRLLLARPCQLLSALQQQLGEGQNVPVYVMYVYLSVTARNTLQALLSTDGYESAYKHCLIEREVMALCLRLGIVFARQITPARVTLHNIAIRIHPQDVAVWMGVSSGHFATCRTDVASARRAHLLLRQLHQEVQRGLPVSPSFTSHFAGFLGTLNSLLGTRTLPAVDVHNGYTGAANTDVADVSAVRMKISALRVLVADVKLRWPEQAERVRV